MTNITTLKIGKMPGRLEEFALETSTTVAGALQTAGLEVGEFEVKVDGATVTDFNQQIGNAKTILLTQRVKGNAVATIKVGKMPGRLEEFAVDSTTSIAELLVLANLEVGEFEVKVDGVTATNFDAPVGEAKTVLLTQRVKGNIIKL